MQHWLPYDERRLFRMLRLTREEARVWIADDVHHSFAQLVRRRGLTLDVAVDRLVVPWTRGLGDVRRNVLRARALSTLTQSHLSQHVLFHEFHHPAVGAEAWQVFNTSPMQYLRLRRAGYSPGEIGDLGGRPRRATARAIVDVWRASARTGVRLHETPQARFAEHQVQRLVSYLDSTIEVRRPGPPPTSELPTPEPRLRLLCTIFAGRFRASKPENYGFGPRPAGLQLPLLTALTASARMTALSGAWWPVRTQADA